MAVVVRPVADPDRERWAELYRGYCAFYEVPAPDLDHLWRRLTTGGELECFVAELDGVVVGLAHVRAFPRPLEGDTAGFLDDLTLITGAMQRLRDTPPTELGGLAVQQVEDLSEGSGDLPPTDGLRYRLADGARVIVRPSGTEPKIKAYLEVVLPVDPEDGVGAARIAAAGRLDALRNDVKAAMGL